LKNPILLFFIFILAGCNFQKTTNKRIKKNESFTYHVKSGDNLIKISRKYDLNVADIKCWNNLEGDIILPSQKLNLYFPVNFESKVKFDMSQKELLRKLKLIPLIDSCRSNDRNYDALERLRFNFNTLTNEIDNKSVCDLEASKIAGISFIDFIFQNDSLTTIEITRTNGIELELNKILKTLKERNFRLSKMGFDYYTGQGLRFGNNTKLQISFAFEMAIIWEKYTKNKLSQ
jgi:hypothetical protein